jgi:hypothetical protein
MISSVSRTTPSVKRQNDRRCHSHSRTHRSWGYLDNRSDAIIRRSTLPAIEQDFGLYPHWIGLDGSRKAQSPQQRCQAKHEFTLHRRSGVVIGNDSRSSRPQHQSPTASIQEASVPAAWRTIAQSRRFGSAALRATSVVVNVKSATAVGRGKPCGKGFEESRFEGLD